mgnify:FL=1
MSKLRDLTNKELSTWCNRQTAGECRSCILNQICKSVRLFDTDEWRKVLNDKALDTEIPYYLLDDDEVEYLSTVIAPFYDDIINITRFSHEPCKNKYQYLRIKIENEDVLYFPIPKGNYFLGMEEGRSYTLRELELPKRLVFENIRLTPNSMY